MIFQEYGDPGKPVVFLIHGGGLSNWMWKPQIDALQQQYYIITPILDGHGEENQVIYDSISRSAGQIIAYINENFGGKVFAICGLSVGAQITAEILSRVNGIAKKAVMESALVIPSKIMAAMTKPTLNLSFFLVKKRWFAKLQAKQMYLPDSMFEDYFCDSAGMSKESMINLMTDNASYSIPKNLENTTADVLVLCGEQEYGMMKKSALLLHQKLKHSTLKTVPGCGHGVSLKFPGLYLDLMKNLFLSERALESEQNK